MERNGGKGKRKKRCGIGGGGGGGRGKKEDKWKEDKNRILRHVIQDRSHSVIFSLCLDRWLLCSLLHCLTRGVAPGQSP